MHFFIPIVLILTYFLFYFCKTLINNRRHAAQARAWGCAEPPAVPRAVWYDIFNILVTRTIISYAKQGLLVQFFHDRTKFMSALTGRHCTTFQNQVLGSKAFETSDPENIKAILAMQFQDFVLGLRSQVLEPLLGKAIFSSDGKAWEHSRAMLRPSFTRDRVSDLDLLDRHNGNLHKALMVDADGWSNTMDLQPFFFRLTMDTSTEFLFGHSVESQVAALTGASSETGALDEMDFTRNFEKAQLDIGMRFRLSNLYWLVNTPRFWKTIRRCHSFIGYYVERALRHASAPEKLDTIPKPKGKYIFLEELALQVRDPLTLRYELLSILLAGRDTTASLLGWLFFELARNPAIYSKLRAAILHDFGTYSDPTEISDRKLKDCSYLQYCINEAGRLYPVVPLNARTAAVDTTLPRGGGIDGQQPVYMRKGDSVFFSAFIMHRTKEFWGDDAEIFRPERWGQGRKHGWEFLPFGGGPRICLGQQFALTSAGYTVLKFVQRFDHIQSCEKDPIVRFDTSLTSKIKNGVNVRLHEDRGEE